MSFLDKLKNMKPEKKQKTDVSSDPREAPAGESDELSPKKKILVVGLGSLFIVGGLGFFLLQMGGSGGNRSDGQDFTSMQDKKIEQQSNDSANKLAKLMAEQEEDQDGTVDPLTGEKIASAKDKQAKNKSKEQAQRQPRPKKKAPTPDTSRKKTSEMSLTQDQPKDGARETPQKNRRDFVNRVDVADKILAKLNSIEKKMTNRMDALSSKVDNLSRQVKHENEQVRQTISQVKLTAKNSSPIKTDKYEEILAQKKALEKQVSKLKAQVQEYKGKWEWVRHLEAEKEDKLEAMQEKLKKLQEKKQGLQQKLDAQEAFKGWRLSGFSESELYLLNEKTGRVQQVKIGQEFKGIKIKRIDVAKGKIYTNMGTLSKVIQ